ncbi:hypothetical protein P7C70_g9543, partial [Phenoliferia sp. Uapishka_3]
MKQKHAGRKKNQTGDQCSPYVPHPASTPLSLPNPFSTQDSEARLDRMRKKRKKDHDGKGEGEKALDRQLKGLGPPGAEGEERESNGTVIIRPDKGKGKEVEQGPAPPLDPGAHINFWSEFEAGQTKTTGADHEKALAKVIEQAKMDELTKMYLAKKGEGDMRGWYAREDLKTDREIKEGVEGNLERAYKDGEHKRLSDPLALMNSFLKRRSDVISGKAIPRQPLPSSRDRYPSATPQTDRGDLSPVITSLLAAKRRRGEPIPPPPPPPLSRPTSSSTSTKHIDPVSEANSRVSSERARAAALIAERKRANALKNGSSIASETPRSEAG